MLSPLEPAPDLRVDAFAQLGRLEVSQGARVDASGNGGGVVLIRSGRLLVDHSNVFAQNTEAVDGTGLGLDLWIAVDAVLTNGASLTTDSRGAGRARDVRLTAGSLRIDGSVIGSRALAAGNSGDIMVQVGTLMFTDSAQIDSSTSGSGNGGHLRVTATDVMSIAGLNSGLSSSTGRNGRAGDITVEAGRLTLTGGAAFRSNASSANNRGGGNVTIAATDAIVISGSSVISIGPVTLTAPTVRIENRGTIGNPTFGGSGAADIVIEARQLTLTDDALITSSTASAGRGGDIRIQGDRVTLTGGATIRSQTLGIGASGTGPGGRITITATDVVAIAGPNSGLFTGTQNRGPGGDITLHVGKLRLSDGATISATSSGTGDAGRLTVTATERFRSDRSTITAKATQANGGVIDLQADQGVLLRDNSTITASIEGGPATVGGNLTITAPFVVLEGSPGSQGSRIIARATAGTGG
jgi:large exoprotein involved in heme utilization and adhesion